MSEIETKKSDGLTSLVRDAAASVIGWFNPNTGQGDPTKDKGKGVIWAGGVALHETTLESLFAFNDLAYTIVTARPEWGLRHGWDLALEAPGTDGAAAVSAQKIESAVRYEMDRLSAHEAQLKASIWGENFGGGLLVVGAVDGRETKDPLDEKNLQRIAWLRDVARTDCRILARDEDAASGRLGLPLLYEVRDEFGRYTIQHFTRVIAYPGAHTPRRLKVANKGWDYSVLDRVIATLSGYDTMWDYARAMMADGSQGIWKIQGLFQQVMSGTFDKLRERLAIADEVKSVFNSLIVDADKEGYEYIHRQYAGVDGLLAQNAIRTAAAAQMPVTVLFGQSPAGLNATGESDIRLWYDRVEQFQESVLRSRLERLIGLIFLSKKGPTKGVEPKGWNAVFRPVRKATPMEGAELRARQAQVDTANINAKIVDPDEVAVSRFTSEGWSAETQIAIELRRKRLLAKQRAEIERLQAEETAPTAGGAGDGVQAQALNGAQQAEARETVKAVAQRQIPRETGVRLLMLAFPQQLDRASAEEFLDTAGTTFEPATPDAKATADTRFDAGDGVMIAVWIPLELATELAIAGGEAPEQMHITLAYLGKEIDPAAIGFLQVALARFASSAAPLAGSIGGLGRFNASSTTDGLDVIYAPVDVPGLAHLRAGLVDVLESIAPARTDHDFTPHITIAYVAPGAAAPLTTVATRALRIAELDLVVGGARQAFPLGALPALVMPALPARASDVTDPPKKEA